MTYLATFHTHFGALSLQRALKKQGLPAQMMPVPRSLSASCGVCIRFSADTAEAARGAEDLESVYEERGGSYSLLYHGD